MKISSNNGKSSSLEKLAKLKKNKKFIPLPKKKIPRSLSKILEDNDIGNNLLDKELNARKLKERNDLKG